MIVHCAADTEDGHDGATSPDFVAPSSMTDAEAPLTDAEAATRTTARGTRKRFMCSLNTSGSPQLRCARAAAACAQAHGARTAPTTRTDAAIPRTSRYRPLQLGDVYRLGALRTRLLL